MSLFNWLRINKNTNKEGVITLADREKIRGIWRKIDDLVLTNRPSAVKEAVLEADKTLAFALSKLYPDREDVAGKLKAVKDRFKSKRQDYENLWYAHKIRNEMVHTVDFHLPTIEAKNILEYFRKGLEILGAI